MKSAAVLLTCYNRAQVTLACLTRLFEQKLPENLSLEIWLVDDASPDKTGELVKKQFPSVHLIHGNGHLFWCGGMRLAWESAARTKDYDFYLWLNDDTYLFPDSLCELFQEYDDFLAKTGKVPVITMSCCDKKTGEFSYGGRDEAGPVLPLGKDALPCKYINGNCTLIPRAVYAKIGGLSPLFIHAIGDHEYGLRALKNGIPCLATGKYLANCSDHFSSEWNNSGTPLRKRLHLLFSPKGASFREYLLYRRMYWGRFQSVIDAFKIISSVLFPNLYSKCKKAIR